MSVAGGLFELDDDVNENVVCIPFMESDELEDEPGIPSLFYPDFLPEGPQIRFQAYSEAWEKCLQRVQDLLKGIYRPAVDQLVQFVQRSHAEQPASSLSDYQEIPTCIVVGSNHSDIFDSFAREVESDKNVFICRLTERDFSNMGNVMKALVSGFIAYDPDPPKRKTTTSLSVQDMRLLESWYESLEESSEKRHLVLMLQDVESLDANLVQDLLYICSLHASNLPICILCGTTSKDYLVGALPKTIRTLLDISYLLLPDSARVFETTIGGLFFDPTFSPDMMIGSPVFKALRYQFTNFNSSVDSLLSHLQLVFLSHFRNPMTAFSTSSMLGASNIKERNTKLITPENRPFLDHLRARVHDFPTEEDEPAAIQEWATTRPNQLFRPIDDAREDFHNLTTLLRLALSVIRCIHDFIQKHGLAADLNRSKMDYFEQFLDQRVVVEEDKWNSIPLSIRSLCRTVKKLSNSQVKLLLKDIEALLSTLPDQVLEMEGTLRSELMTAVDGLLDTDSTPMEVDNSEGESAGTTGAEIGEWLARYFEKRLVPLQSAALWEVWFTGTMILPIELLNPSPHTTVLAALTQPEAVLGQYDRPASPNKHGKGKGKAAGPQQQGMSPDTCILFQRYLDSGKTINLYDWYESFVSTLAGEIRETQDPPSTPSKRTKRQADSDTPSKRSAKGDPPTKGKGKESPAITKKKSLAEIDDSDVSDSTITKEKEKELEAWRRQVYARFMRSVHELDYMGFIRWSGKGAGRKGSECVGKLVWGGADYE